MRSWNGQKVWKKWSGRLSLTEKDDFTRMSLPFIRLLWPSAQQTPNLKSWDAKGVDIVVWDDKNILPCVIQCKGFVVQDLGSDQIYQVKESIEKFLESDLSAERYILIHNRDGRHQEFNKKVNQHLQKLVAHGKVKTAELWDRQQILNRSFDRMEQILNEALREYSKYLLNHFQNLFKFSRFYIPRVPYNEQKLVFKRGAPCSKQNVRSSAFTDIREILLSPSEARWTLLTGIFGTGKTTAALHAATTSKRVILFLPCATLSRESLMSGTNMLLEEALKPLRILGEFDDQDRIVLDEIAGVVLSYLLRHPESSYALIIDGLDENRVFDNLEGLQQLSNKLADFDCPIVMTTRTEHINPMFGNFSLAFHELSTKKGRYQHARLLELERWGKEQVLQLIDQITESAMPEEKATLAEFRRLINSGEYASLYADLPFHPLFLQFILEDVITYGIRQISRALLLRSWIERKIRRDRMSWAPRTVSARSSLDDSIDLEDFVARMIFLMENVAHLMIQKNEDAFELSESIDSSHINKEAEKLFNLSSDPILAILLNSVLIAQSPRRGANVKVIFALRAFQEYFLASYLNREKIADSAYPQSVRSFCSEIKSFS